MSLFDLRNHGLVTVTETRKLEDVRACQLFEKLFLTNNTNPVLKIYVAWAVNQKKKSGSKYVVFFYVKTINP